MNVGVHELRILEEWAKSQGNFGQAVLTLIQAYEAQKRAIARMKRRVRKHSA